MRTRQLIFRVVSLLIFSVSLSVLMGWMFSIPSLAQIISGLPPMNPLTAVLFLMCTVIMVGFSFSKSSQLLVRGIQGLSIVIMVSASSRLLDLVTGNFFQFDQLLFSSKLSTLFEQPSRMAVATALCFVLFGLAVFLRVSAKKWVSLVSLTLLLLALGLVVIAGLCYLLRSISILESAFFLSMALHTVILFIVMFLTTFFIRPIFIPQSPNNLSLALKLMLLGGFFILLIPFWIFGLLPEVTKLSTSFMYQADIASIDNFYDVGKQRFSGETTSKTKFSYEAVGQDQNVLLVKNTFDVRKYNDEPIFFVERLYGIDRSTGQHVRGYGDRDRTGYLFGPRNGTKQDFTYWHVNYDSPALMKFVREDRLYGLPVYEYHASYQADQTVNLTYLPEIGTTKGISLDVELTLWVEPMTGRLITYHDQATAWYYDLATNQRLQPWNQFSNRPTPLAVRNQTLIAQQQIWDQMLGRTLVPMSLFGLALLCLLLAWLKKYPNTRVFTMLPFIVLVSGTIITAVVFLGVRRNNANLADLNFENDVDTIVSQIANRLRTYAFTLHATTGFVNSSTFVSRDEWKQFVEIIEVQHHYPGVQGIGFIEMIEPTRLVAFEKEIQTEGFPNFKVTPPGEREMYSAVKYLEPFDLRNQQVFGYDMYQDPVRGSAMRMAAKLDEPVISDRVTLLHESEPDLQPGFLMFLPIYSPDSTVSAKSAIHTLKGFAFSPFRMKDFMNGVLLNQDFGLGVEIFDSDGVTPDSLTDESKMFSQPLKQNGPSTSEVKPHQLKIRNVEMFGHKWTIRFQSGDDYGLDTFQKIRPQFLLMVGMVVTILLSSVLYSLTSTRNRALHLAEQMTQDIQQQKMNLEKANQTLSTEVSIRKKFAEELQSKNKDIERFNTVMIDREIKMVELKDELKKCQAELQKHV